MSHAVRAKKHEKHGWLASLSSCRITGRRVFAKVWVEIAWKVEPGKNTGGKHNAAYKNKVLFSCDSWLFCNVVVVVKLDVEVFSRKWAVPLAWHVNTLQCIDHKVCRQWCVTGRCYRKFPPWMGTFIGCYLGLLEVVSIQHVPWNEVML